MKAKTVAESADTLAKKRRDVDHQRHLLGVFLVVCSALAYSVAGVLTKSIAADAWTIACWRGLIGGALIVGYVAWAGRSRPFARMFRLGRGGWLLAVVGSAASFAFILAFKMTYVANVAVIYATASFMAAGLSWLLLRERPRIMTLMAALFSFAGVAVIVSGGAALGKAAGDFAALVMTAGNALYMTLIRLFRETDAVLAGAMSALLLFPLAFLFTSPLAVDPGDISLLILFGFAWAAALVLWTEGTKLIPAAESGLFGTAEVPFAAILAWVVLSELPPVATAIGGSIVIVAVVAHAGSDFRRARAAGKN